MITIVTGKINSFKTTRLKELYLNHPEGDGFLSIKKMHENQVLSYDLYRLKTGETRPFIVTLKPENETEIETILGPYYFLKSGFAWVEEVLSNIIDRDNKCVFLDEIGILEMNELGFHKILTKCIEAKLELYLTIRKDLITSFQEKYQVKEMVILE